ncbi:sensor domain-containing diguanylate cyclase [Vreelandella zhanjiangensis]|uniref:sensor domain-containing diguanylate cyclase n=1 Tax=Vreelandella zhanjiangensis TaxID=1121960 RepID=UPI000372AC07|nr:sensor domain-containing diguanylate cyclase [Halomonas zhanjiangensis]
MSKHHPLLQSFGALLVLDADSRHIQATSTNLEALVGVSASPAQKVTLNQLLGKRMAQRVRRELQGQQRLAAPLVFSHGLDKQARLQLRAYRSGEHVIMEIEPLVIVGQRRLLGAINEQLIKLTEAANQEELLTYLVNEVRQLTGFERVTICHFDPDWHSHIVAEAKDAQLPAYVGQRMAASDTPLALRRAYARHPVRFIEDAKASFEPLMPNDFPVNLGASVLRAPAPERQCYMQRLGVRAMLCVAMQRDTGLWGLLSCFSATPHPVPASVRDAVHILVQMATERLALLRARQEARYLKRVQDSLMPATSAHQEPQSPQQLLFNHANTWMTLFRAHGIALWVAGGIYQVGKTPTPEVISQFVIRLGTAHTHSGPWCTRHIAKEPLTSSLAMPEQSGVLAVPLPMNPAQRAWLCFFRPEQVEALYWSMQPTSQVTPSVCNSPPAAWYEDIIASSEAWQRVERLAAVKLGEDLTLAISRYEIGMLNMHLENERKALAAANQRLEQLAHFDPLTQVWNRYRIEQAIDTELVAAKRYGAGFALLLFDVDHFKMINDTHGHSLGDDVLVALARLVENSLRGCDYFGRWGGEEFVVLATHSDLQAALGLAERLRTLLTTLHVAGLNQLVTVSIGIAVWQPGDSCKTLIARADQAMYRAKRDGRDRVEIAGGEIA